MSAAPDVIRLWPEGPPTPIESGGEEVSYVNKAGIAAGTTSLRNISEATLTVLPPDGEGNGRGVIVVPGGGWTVNMWTHEGIDVANWLRSEGYTNFVLKYRVQASLMSQEDFEAMMSAVDADVHSGTISNAKKPRAISDVISTDSYLAARLAAAEDGRRAIAIVREMASQWGIAPDSLGMIGFSAGAFLAVDVALDPQAEPLAWIAPIYGGETRGAPVPADAPPMFLAVAQDDVLCKIVEGLHADWSAADRSSELHVFARGQHGFALVKQNMPSDLWADLFLAWLRDR
jgi:acetyl esterase/lipase